MEAIIIAISRGIELLFAEGAVGIATAFKAIGALAVLDWMKDHPQITVGGIAVGVYIAVAANKPTKQ
jgi:hypothetical protein